MGRPPPSISAPHAAQHETSLPPQPSKATSPKGTYYLATIDPKERGIPLGATVEKVWKDSECTWGIIEASWGSLGAICCLSLVAFPLLPLPLPIPPCPIVPSVPHSILISFSLSLSLSLSPLSPSTISLALPLVPTPSP